MVNRTIHTLCESYERSRQPVFSALRNAIEGMGTIRLYKQSEAYTRKFEQLQLASQQRSFHISAVNRYMIKES